MTVQIPVTADVGSVKKGVEDIAKTIEKANRVKWNPIDLQGIRRDIKEAERLLWDFQRRTGTSLTGGGVTPQSPVAPRPAPSGEVEEPVSAGSGGRRRRGGRGRYTYAPEFSDVGRSFMGGIGGGFGTIAGYATRGAYAGANSGGGAAGGGIGLLRGLGIGALAFGAMKGGQAINEGVDMAKERAITLDTLKRQMGDLGTSLNILKLASEGAGDSMGMNSKESAKLMEEFTKLSRGADKTEEALMQSAATSGRTARAYGLDPSVAASFYGGIRHTDPRQNNRELALMLAEAVNRSGMTARVDEVMQSIQTFAAASARMSLSSPNLNAYAGAYGDLVGSKTPGLDSETSAALLAQANSSIMRMGGAGEAGQAFILAALNRNGGLNPIQAAALAQGGLFGSRRGVFGGNSEIGKFVGPSVGRLADGGGADVTNFEAIRSHLARMGGNKWFQLEGAQRLFGVSSLANAAALLNLSGNQAGGLQRSLAGAGVDINSLNESGIQTLAQIGGAKDKGRLSEIFGEMSRRTGAGALSSGEREALTRAQGGTFQEFKTALIKVAALKDQAETDGSRLRASIASLESQEIKIGDKLLMPLNAMRDALIFMSGKGESSLAREAQKIRVKDVNETADADLNRIRAEFNQRRTATRRSAVFEKDNYNSAGYFKPGVSSTMSSALSALDDEQGAVERRIEADRNARLKELSMSEQAALSAGSSSAAAPGSTPLPLGAVAGSGGSSSEHIVIDSRHVVQTVGSDGRVTSEKASNVRVRKPRGSGTVGVSHDAN